MKKFLLISIIFFISFFAYPESIKIIDVIGRVYVKVLPTSSYEVAKIGMELNKDSEIKTESSSVCTIVFDNNPNNVLTVKENTQIVIKKLKPVNLYLLNGNIFALVRDIKDVEEFKVQTPNAITGVRGTGEGINFINSNTQALCFEGSIEVDSFDPSGNKKDSKILNENEGISVSSDGSFSEIFPIEKEDLEDWQNFLEYLSTLNNNEDTDKDNKDNFKDIMEEKKDSYRESNLEENRREEQEEDTVVDDGGKYTTPPGGGGY